MTVISRLRALPHRLIRSIETPRAPSVETNVFADVRLLEISPEANEMLPPVPDTVVINGTAFYTSESRPVQIHHDEHGFTEVTVTLVPRSLEIRMVEPAPEGHPLA